jgi:hypothetical protein
MRRFLLLFFILSANSTWGQGISTKYADLITTEGLYDKLSILASDALEGRETGERGQKMAAALIQNHFDKLGLMAPVPNNSKKIFQQQLPLYTPIPGDIFITINNEKKKNFEDVVYMTNQFSKTETPLDLVYAGNGSNIILENMNVTNKAVIFISSGKSTWHPAVDELKSAGAKLVLVINTTDQDEFSSMAQNKKDRFENGKLSLEIPKPIDQGGNTGIFLISPVLAGEILNSSIET